jgi:hypothetical protein
MRSACGESTVDNRHRLALEIASLSPDEVIRRIRETTLKVGQVPLISWYVRDPRSRAVAGLVNRHLPQIGIVAISSLDGPDDVRSTQLDGDRRDTARSVQVRRQRSWKLTTQQETGMKRLMTAMCCTCLIGAAAAAQTTSTDQVDKDKMSKSMMVTGCVAAGPDADHYMLTNGMVVGETAGKTYDLTGGELKAHMGHKVEITGTLDDVKMTDKDQPTSKEPTAKDKTTADAHAALQVTSVRMISASCP